MYHVIAQPFSLESFTSLEDWFGDLQYLPGAMLLHSGRSSHENAQFHIASGFPLLTLELFASGKVNITAFDVSEYQLNDAARERLADVVSELHSNPMTGPDIFERAQQVQQALFADHRTPNNALPFQCGAMGFAGYDYGRFLEDLPQQAKDEYQTPVFSISYYGWSLVQNQQTNECWLCYSDLYSHPGFTEVTIPSAGKHYFTAAEKSKAEPIEFKLTSDWQSNMSEQEYKDKLHAIHEYLLSGDCYQVNLAQRFEARYQGCEWQAFQALSEANQAPFSAFLRTDKSCIVSCSPERFLSVRHGLIETKPIKGTRPRFRDAEQDKASKDALINSEKDQSENLMIVDLLRNDISKNALPHSVNVTGLFEIESFNAVHHLVSTIQAKLKPASHPFRLLQDAFPGGSITGAPKIRAMEIIDELEPHRRNIYCGSIFVYGVNGDFDSSICIRTLLFENQKVFCWAGGGIVADSVDQAEYEETFHKVNKILPVLAGFRKCKS
ncbi:aminodeoxychorismate synthase component I [Planctobacterium marinum]